MSADEGFDKARVMQRVTKMLALANDAAASEGERDNAMRMVHATLAKYNLSIAEVEASGKQPKEARGQQATKTRSRPWIRVVMHSVAERFFCEYFYMDIGKSQMHNYFIGRESNVQTAIAIALYVMESIRKEGRARQAALGEVNGWYTSFTKGAAVRVRERCLKLRREAEAVPAQPSSGTALVLASVYEQEMAANKALIPASVKPVKSRAKPPGEGFHEGYEHGDKVGLTPQVGGKAQHKALT